MGSLSDQARRCLLTVHAHPDDESSKGPATVARYHAAGVRTVLVCCTGGEAGDILNPAMDRPEVRADLAAIRRRELEAAVRVIGYDELVWLGYRDSGMPGTPANADPRCFAQADLGEAVGRLVAVLRRERPQVVVTYPEDQRGYPHPDHLRVHEVTMAAVEAAADPEAYPEAGRPWQVAKVYASGFSGRRVLALHEKFLELGLESPFDERWLERARTPQPPPTTQVDVRAFSLVRREALLAHRTQVDPTSRWWFGLPPEVEAEAYPVDEYWLLRVASGWTAPLPAPLGPGPVEDDLFAGVGTEEDPICSWTAPKATAPSGTGPRGHRNG
jgi:mycothiol S-conjugate amidase